MFLSAFRHPRHFLDPSAWPIQFDYLPAWQVLVLIALLAAPMVLLGIKSLNWQSPARQAASIGLRVAVVWVLVMTLAGARWQRRHRDLEVVAVRDVSASVGNVSRASGGYSIQSSVDQALLQAGKSRDKPTDDKLGAVRFDSQATVDALPRTQFQSISGAFRSVDSARATDIASAINLAMACFSGHAMKRLVLISDGNANMGDTSAAVDAAIAAHIPIDVIPLSYHVAHEVMLERLVAPGVLRDGEAYGLDVILRSTNPQPVPGKLTVWHQGLPVDVNPDVPGVQTSVSIVVKTGATSVHLPLPADAAAGLNEFHAVFDADSPDADTLVGNNSADAFSFVRGKGKLLFVDNVPDGQSQRLIDALSSQNQRQPWQIDRVEPAVFPSRLIDLEPYDAIILANVPRGASGIDDEQTKILAQYVRDTGGGLLVIGGPDALGAGGWQPGSEFEKILPVNFDVSAQRVMPAGALVLVLDHSGSMAQSMPGDPTITKQQVANESSVLAAKALLPRDLLGVIAFDAGSQWVIQLAENRDPGWAAERIRNIAPGGSTSIGPALEEAYRALMRLTPDQAPARRILLLTDGRSLPYDFASIAQKISDAGIVLSTVGMGGDADRALLSELASRGKGSSYFVDDARQLKQIFVREAQTLRRALIHEPPGGVGVVRQSGVAMGADMLGGLSDGILPPLGGIVLSTRKSEPPSIVLLGALNEYNDPILARWKIGLGQTAVFTGDATSRWAATWINSGEFDSFWAQVVRTVARPPVSDRFDITAKRDGAHTKLVIEIPESDAESADFYRFTGKLASTAAAPPMSTTVDLRPVQTGPGRYEMTLDTDAPGNYVAALQYESPTGQRGTLLAGTTIGASPELRDLASNDALLNEVAVRTGGRIIPSLEAADAEMLFAREGLTRSTSSMPLHDILLPALIGMIVMDVGVRRLTWDRLGIKRIFVAGVAMLQSFTTTRKINARPTLAALKRIRAEHREIPDLSMPDPRAKFEAKVEARAGVVDYQRRPQVVFAARDLPCLEAVRATPVQLPRAGSLLEAKRRAQEQFKRQQEEI